MTTSTVARDTFRVFGTTAVLLVTDPTALAEARTLADAELAGVDQACSRFRPDSELAALNAARGTAVTVSELFADLLAAALRAARLTDGDVDPTCGRALAGLGYDRDFDQVRAGGPASLATVLGPVPGWRRVELDEQARQVRLPAGTELDLGATAKAWASDHCAELIADRLGCGVLVSLGGDLAVAGPVPDGGWRVRVTDDHAAGPEEPGQTVTITEGGLATSSTTVRTWTAGSRQVHHIIDPATGEPAPVYWRTVSVAAGSCVDANTASTAAIIRGQAAAGWLDDAGLPARLVRPDGTVVTTAGWPAADTGPGSP
ncbi:MAG TPA: FAD:protein FMN transferase [Streptosporangiaceae bacterium]|nr:FAD:protein FMN transferase [Streptosporangiaceae bacterium]